MFCFSRKVVIPVISLRGIISSTGDITFKNVNKLLTTTLSMSNVKTVAIIIDSPGGSPVQSNLIHNHIRRLAEEKQVTILTFIYDLGASGGYYIACAGDEIYALNSSIVGSIGVISGGFGFQELIKNHGIERRIYTQGENKSILDPFMPEKETDVKVLLDVEKDVYDEFVEIVKLRRGDKLSKEDDTIFTGKFWSGKKAKELGLVDDIGDIYSILHKKYGKNIEIKYIKENKSLLSSLKSYIGIESMFKLFYNTVINNILLTLSQSRFRITM